MEPLYSKLYDKYTTLKKKKLSELDEVNKDQEVKFLNYVSVAEELIQHLNGENGRLRTQVSDLRSEVASIRSTKDEQCAEYQKLLMEENQKNKLLSEEVKRLQNQLQEGPSCSSKDGKNDGMQLSMPETAQATSGELSSGSMRRLTRKRSREARAEMEKNMVTHGSSALHDAMARESAEHSPYGRKSAKPSSKGTVFCGDVSTDQQPECCKRTVDQSGCSVISDSGLTNCQFQALIEYLVGMKLSTVNETEGICISALHQSSGYSFSLTWVSKAAGEEPELLYRVLTLGTFERIAPEWMRSVLMFSMSMCPIFFERVARVIKMHR